MVLFSTGQITSFFSAEDEKQILRLLLRSWFAAEFEEQPCGPQNVPTKNHVNFISARSSEDPILLGKMQGAHHFDWGKNFTWKNTETQGAHQEPTILLGKTQGAHQEPTILLGKTQGAHQEPTILLRKTQGAQPFTHWEI